MHNYLLLGILLSLLTTLPLAWKWQLGVLRVAWVVLALATLSGLSVALVGSLVTIAAGLLHCAAHLSGGMLWSVRAHAQIKFQRGKRAAPPPGPPMINNGFEAGALG